MSMPENRCGRYDHARARPTHATSSVMPMTNDFRDHHPIMR
jgi:hypothetical protein